MISSETSKKGRCFSENVKNSEEEGMSLKRLVSLNVRDEQ